MQYIPWGWPNHQSDLYESPRTVQLPWWEKHIQGHGLEMPVNHHTWIPWSPDPANTTQGICKIIQWTHINVFWPDITKDIEQLIHQPQPSNNTGQFERSNLLTLPSYLVTLSGSLKRSSFSGIWEKNLRPKGKITILVLGLEWYLKPSAKTVRM